MSTNDVLTRIYRAINWNAVLLFAAVVYFGITDSAIMLVCWTCWTMGALMERHIFSKEQPK